MSDKKEYFDYLDALRESGAINMFDSPRYLVQEFGITMYEARQTVIEWMNQYGKN